MTEQLLQLEHEPMQAAPERPTVNQIAHPVHPVIADRWSPRAFSDRLVEPAVLRSVLEAARWAPSAANAQPWHFILATKDDPDGHERLLGTLMEGNIRWANRAPVLMLVIVKQYSNREGVLTSRSLYDAGLAVGALTFEAGARGLVVHQMGGFYEAKVRETYSVPEGYEPAAALALGYPGDPESLPEDLRAREQAPRTRKDLADFVFGGEWGQSADLVRGS
jgi:nitroreductase